MRSRQSEKQYKNGDFMDTKHRKYFVRVTVAVFVIAVLIGIFGYYEVRQYDESILEIYAEQQDSYVKLVLDQINLQKDRTDEEMIDDILNSLVASDKRYWTLTKDQDILYVKDVSETNRYKGFTSDSYYLSTGGKAFVDSLETDRIIHDTIEIDQERYVASGTKFSYLGKEYKICLLTYENVILDNNKLLQTRIMICIVLFALLLILIIAIMAGTQMLDKKNEKLAKLSQRVVTLNKEVESLEDKLTVEFSYNAGNSIFHESVLAQFLEKLEKRKVAPLTMVMLQRDKKSDIKQLFQKIDQSVGKKYLKFEIGTDRLLLLFLMMPLKDLEPKILPIVQEEMTYLGAFMIEDDYQTYQSQYEKFCKKNLRTSSSN